MVLESALRQGHDDVALAVEELKTFAFSHPGCLYFVECIEDVSFKVHILLRSGHHCDSQALERQLASFLLEFSVDDVYSGIAVDPACFGVECKARGCFGIRDLFVSC